MLCNCTTGDIMQNYNCKNCGAVLYWDVDEGCLKCEFCGMKYQPSDFEDYTDTTEEVKNEEVEQQYTNTEPQEDMAVYECKNCGGEIVTLKTTMATICPYCGEAVSITSKSAGVFRPELCIPFKKDKADAMRLYKKYVKRSFLTPKKFKLENTLEKCQGLFAPFYLHTIDDRAKHRFEGEKTGYKRRGDDRVTTHRVFELILEADGKFERVPTDGSVRIDDAMMEAIEPFDYSECKAYNPAYMAGFAAEQTDDDKKSLDARAVARVEDGMRTKAQQAFSGYSTVTLKNETNAIGNHTSEYVMMPVWLLNINHNGKKYTYAINGQSGKVTGKLPIDKVKLASILAGTFVGANLILSLITALL